MATLAACRTGQQAKPRATKPKPDTRPNAIPTAESSSPSNQRATIPGSIIKANPVAASRAAAVMSSLLIVLSPPTTGERWEDPEDIFRILPHFQLASTSWLSVVRPRLRHGMLVAPYVHRHAA